MFEANTKIASLCFKPVPILDVTFRNSRIREIQLDSIHPNAKTKKKADL